MIIGRLCLGSLAVVVAVAAASLGHSRATKRLPAYALTFRMEYATNAAGNYTYENRISPGGPQPVKWLSACAVAFIGADPAPDVYVDFAMVNTSGGTWFLSQTHVKTTQEGQALTQVRPGYGSPTGTLRAT